MLNSFEFGDKFSNLSAKITERRTKAHGSLNNRSFTGYINAVTESDILSQSYLVTIPELGNEIVRAPAGLQLGETQTNGSGYKPFAPEPGTIVRLKYHQESNQVYIEHAINCPGVAWGLGPTLNKEIPEKDNPQKSSIHTPPFTNDFIDLAVASEVKITPWEIGKPSPYGELVPAGTFVPGSKEINSPTGIKYEFYAGGGINFTPLSISKTQGVLKTYDEKAMEVAVLKKDTFNKRIQESVRTHFSFADRLIKPTKVLETAPQIVGTLIEDNEGVMQVLQGLEDTLETIQKLAVIGDQFIQWISQNPAVIIEDLLQTFGQFDLDLGVVGIDLSLSLTSIDINVDFRIGTGIAQLDTLINTVLNTVINTLLDNLLKNFKLGEILGLDLSGLLGGDSVDTDKTYVHNLFTPILRFTNTPTSESAPSISSLINSFSSLIKLEESYANPTIILQPTSLAPVDDLELLRRFLVQSSSSLSLYYLPDYLNNLYLFGSEKDLIACLIFACSAPEDLIRCSFLYGYYAQSKLSCSELLNHFYKVTKLNKLLDKYKIYEPNNYYLLSELVEGEVYNPLELDLNVLKDTISNPFTQDALEVLISGNFLEFINRCIIIQSKKDLRLDFPRYTKLKHYTDQAYPEVHIGYE